MKTAVIIHGTPSKASFLDYNIPAQSNCHWIPWVQKQLLCSGYHTWAPEMPLSYAPDYALWQKEFERYSIDEQSLLVGHSCGGGFLLRWLSENPVIVKRLVLVAPWLDPFREKCPEFFEFELDRKISDRCEVHLFASDNDDGDINQSVDRIRATFPSIKYRIFPGYGHFCLSDMGSDRFPELAAVLLT